MADSPSTPSAWPIQLHDVADPQLLATELGIDLAIVVAQPLMRKSLERQLRHARPHAHGTFHGVEGRLRDGARVLVFEAPSPSCTAVAAATWQARVLCPSISLLAWVGRAVPLPGIEEGACNASQWELIGEVGVLALPPIILRRDDPAPRKAAEPWATEGKVDVAGTIRPWRLDDGMQLRLHDERFAMGTKGVSMVTLGRSPASPLEWEWVSREVRHWPRCPGLADLGGAGFAHALAHSASLPPGHAPTPRAVAAVAIEHEMHAWPLHEAAPRGANAKARLRSLDEALEGALQWIQTELEA